MADFIARRQLLNSTENGDPTAYITTLSASNPAAQAESVPTQTPNPEIPVADVSTSSAVSPTAVSLTETVILIAPSGTVGGSIIITSVPISAASSPITSLSGPSSIGLESSRFPTPSSLNLIALSTLSSASLESLSPTVVTRSSSAALSASITSLPTDTTPTSGSQLVSRSVTSADELISSTSETTSTQSPSSSLSLSSTSSSLSTSTSSSTSTTLSSSNTVSQLSATSSPAELKETKPLSTGGIAAVGVSAVGAAFLVGLLLIFLCRRRRRRRRRVPSVYPEEAFLYDPPMVPSDHGPGNVETTEYRRAGEVGSVYGVHGESLVGAGLARPRTPDANVNERDSLLSRMRQGGRPRTASSSLMNQSPPRLSTTSRGINPMHPGGGYMPTPIDDHEINVPPIGSHTSGSSMMSPLRYHPFSPAGYEPAPVDEGDVADQRVHDPFADPADTSYNPGFSVMDPSHEIRHNPR